MGQENDKVVFGDQNQLNTRKRDKIFNKIYTVKTGVKDSFRESPYYNRPENIQSYSQDQSVKCPQIQFDMQPRCKKPLRKIYNYSDQKRTYPIEQQNPIYYYNAWSLPTQKCFIEKQQRDLNQRVVTESQSEPQIYYDNYGVKPEDSGIRKAPVRPSYNKPYYGEQSHVEKYDFDRVKSDNRMQNLFLFDKS